MATSKVTGTASAPVTTPPPEGPRIGDFLAAALRKLDEDLAATLPRVHGNADVEAIHDMRVVIRRLRVILKFARPVYGRYLADIVRRAFSELQGATGTLRDEEVLEETLEKCGVDDPAFTAFRNRRKVRERTLRKATLGVLEAGTEPARKLLEALIALPVKPKRDVAAAEFAARCVARAEKELREHQDAEPTDAIALHELRIAYKQLRYALDIFVDVLPAASVARSKEAANFQKRLGEIHDLDVAQDTVIRARGLPEDTQKRALKALASTRDEALGKFLVLKVHVAQKAAQAHAETVRAKAAAVVPAAKTPVAKKTVAKTPVAKKRAAKKAARKTTRGR